MKKLIINLVVLVAICLLMYISVCNDRSGCICSILTTEDTKHPITSILESVLGPLFCIRGDIHTIIHNMQARKESQLDSLH